MAPCTPSSIPCAKAFPSRWPHGILGPIAHLGALVLGAIMSSLPTSSSQGPSPALTHVGLLITWRLSKVPFQQRWWISCFLTTSVGRPLLTRYCPTHIAVVTATQQLTGLRCQTFRRRRRIASWTALRSCRYSAAIRRVAPRRQRCFGKKGSNVTDRQRTREKTGKVTTTGKTIGRRAEGVGRGRGDGSESRVIVLSTIFQTPW